MARTEHGERDDEQLPHLMGEERDLGAEIGDQPDEFRWTRALFNFPTDAEYKSENPVYPVNTGGHK